uniref:Histone H2A n=1 Tax=Panagrolaimus sp. JU765 TaxID=591449 RepID=A0AC34QPY7_9BILA
MLGNNAKGKGRISTTKRADVLFSVPKCRSFMKQIFGKKRRVGASIYMASVLSYLTAELLEIAGNVAHQCKKNRISPRFVNVSIRGDQEMFHLLQKVTIREAGVIPHIHRALTLKKRSRNADFLDFDENEAKSNESKLEN